MSVAAELHSLRIGLGATPDHRPDTGLPVLAGPAVERLFPAAQPLARRGDFSLFTAERWLLGIASVPAFPGLETTARRLYAAIFEATQGLHLARIWNYVPDINAPGADGIENYRAFCRARSLAFEQHHGPGFKALLPAASAVGTDGRNLTVLFAATPATPRHVENPLQVSAYDYPPEYGPRPPSFARATVADGLAFISGTAAIRGHATVAPHQIAPQVVCTLENLREIARACGLGTQLDRLAPGATRHFKVYLRQAADQPLVAAMLRQELLRTEDSVSYLRADVCRSALMIEIEATLAVR